MLRGGSRSGKTFLLIRAIVQRAINAPGSRHAVFRFRFNHAKTTIWADTLPKVLKLCFPTVPARFDKTDFFVELPGGSQIWIGGLDDKERVEKVLGAEYVTLYFNESSQIPWGSIELAMSRLAQKVDLAPAIAASTGRARLPLKAYFDCNPPSKLHWSYQLFKAHLKPGTKEALSNPGDYAEMRINPEDNRENLPEEYFDVLSGMSAAKRMRFEKGEWASEVNGALWTLEDREGADGSTIPGIDSLRVQRDQLPDMRRIVVAVDPSGTKGDGAGDDIGIVVAGVGVDGRCYVLDDATCQLSPDGWGRRAVDMYHRHKADRVIGERNFGGAMVEFVIKTADKLVPYGEVNASRGKVVRAEPVAALYEQCIAEGQLVETERGAVPIEKVREGEMIWTRKGLRKVLWAGQTGVRETILLKHDNGTLECTPDHPIFCQRGFTDAGLIAPKADMLLAWHDSNMPASHAAHRSGSRNEIVDHVRRQSGGSTVLRFGHSSSLLACAISRTKRVIGARLDIGAANCSIVRSGLRLTGQFLTAITSIISTTIQAITTSQIWNRSIQANMPSITTMAASSSVLTQKSAWVPLNVNDGKRSPPNRMFASNVAGNLKAAGQSFAFAHRPATRVIGVGSVESSGKAVPVYNLHVEGCHEFFAGGVLVHNCKVSHVGDFPDLEDQMCNFTSSGYVGEGSPDRADALVWAITDLMLTGSNYDWNNF